MTELEKRYHAARKERLGITQDKLEVERVPNTISLLNQQQTPDALYQKRLDRHEKNFSVRGLSLEGELGRRLEPTLNDVSIDDAKARAAGFKMVATAKQIFQGKEMRLWLDVKP